MAEKVNENTQTDAEKQAAEAKAKTDAEAKEKAEAEAKKGKTIDEINKENGGDDNDNQPQTVGLDKFLEEKKARKNAEKALKELQKSFDEGATKVEISEDIGAIAKKYDVDPKFLSELAQTIKTQAEKEADEKVSNRIKPLEEKERQQKIDTAFNKHFKIAIDSMPEYAKIVNPGVIKTLSLQPQNANKTFAQIIEETYSSALTGKSTIDSTKPGGGKDAEPLDMTKARTNSKYFDEVMANPELKKEYNEKMLKEGI